MDAVVRRASVFTSSVKTIGDKISIRRASTIDAPSKEGTHVTSQNRVQPKKDEGDGSGLGSLLSLSRPKPPPPPPEKGPDDEGFTIACLDLDDFTGEERRESVSKDPDEMEISVEDWQGEDWGWGLSDADKNIALYEWLLLVFGDKEQHQSALDAVRVCFGISSALHARLEEAQVIQSASRRVGRRVSTMLGSKAPVRASVAYRADLLWHKAPGDLGSAETYRAWHLRQTRFLRDCLRVTVQCGDPSGNEKWDIDGKTLDTDELVKNIEELCETLYERIDEEWWRFYEPEHKPLVTELRKFAQVIAAAWGNATREFILPCLFPLNVSLYERLLLATHPLGPAYPGQPPPTWQPPDSEERMRQKTEAALSAEKEAERSGIPESGGEAAVVHANGDGHAGGGDASMDAANDSDGDGDSDDGDGSGGRKPTRSRKHSSENDGEGGSDSEDGDNVEKHRGEDAGGEASKNNLGGDGNSHAESVGGQQDSEEARQARAQQRLEGCELLHSMRPYLQIYTNVHSVCVSKVSFHIYQATLTSQSLHLLRELLAPTLSLASTSLKDDDDAVEYAKVVVRNVHKWFKARLEDYSEGVDTETLSDQVSLYVDVARCFRSMSSDESPLLFGAQAAVQCIISSVRHAYTRLSSDFNRPIDVIDGQSLVELAAALLDNEEELFAPAFRAYINDETVKLLPDDQAEFNKPESVAVYHLCRQLVCDVRPIISAATDLNFDTVGFLSELAVLENRFLAVCSSASEILELDFLCAHLVDAWVDKQSVAIGETVSLSCWEEVEPGKGVGNVFQAIGTTLAQFLDMGLPSADKCVSKLLPMLCGAAERFAEFMSRDMHPVAVPSRPSCISNRRKDMIQEVFPPEMQSQVAAGPSVNTCIARLNALDFATRQLRTCIASVNQNLPQASVRPFEAAISKVKSHCSTVRKYLAAKATLFELQDVFLRQLYVPCVMEARIGTVTRCLAPVIQQMKSQLHKGQHEAIATNLLVAAVEGLRFVLLDGGRDRRFVQADAVFLVEDVQTLQALFAKHQLSEKVMNACCRDLLDLLNTLFNAPSKQLVAAFETAPETHPCKALTKYNIFRVLRHRTKNDSVAKAFIKPYKKDGELRESMRTLVQ